MRYIKKYEENLYLFSKLEIGDYVLLDTFVDVRIIKIDNKRIPSGDRINTNYKVPSRYAKITKLGTFLNNRFTYKILIITDDFKEIELWITPAGVIRKLNSEEISEFETKKNAIKFNV